MNVRAIQNGSNIHGILNENSASKYIRVINETVYFHSYNLYKILLLFFKKKYGLKTCFLKRQTKIVLR